MRALSALLLSLALVAPLRADAAGAIAVVLPLDPVGSKLSTQDQTLLNEAVISVAGEALSERGYTVLDRDTVIRELLNNDYTMEKVCDSNCALETARELKAEVFVSGKVMASDGHLIVIIRVLDQKKGMQLGSVDVESESIRDLKQAFLQKLESLFTKVPLAPGFVPKPKTVRITFETTPKDATVKIDGQLQCGAQRPCSVELVRGEHVIRIESEGKAPLQEIRNLTESGTLKFALNALPEELPRKKRFALRAGFGAMNGVVGIGGEAALVSNTELPLLGERSIRVGLGSGTHALSGGLSVAAPDMESGLYIDVHLAWVRPGVFGGEMARGVGFGASAGYDFRPISWLSVKTGLGLAWSSANAGKVRPLVLDLALGPVF